MSFNWRKYASSMWSSIVDKVIQDSSRDQSEKVSALARDLYLYVKDLEKKVDANSALLNSNGLVIIVTGSACPSGWVEDTTWRNRFMQGPDAGGGSIGTIGAESITISTGGSHAHVMPTHQHTIPSQADHAHNIYYEYINYQSGSSSMQVASGGGVSYQTYAAGSHNHTGYTGTNPSANTDGAGAHNHSGSNITPAYKRALFCKKQ